MAEYRSDIFGGDELQVEKKIRQDDIIRQNKEHSIWDGHSKSSSQFTQKKAVYLLFYY